VTNYNFLFILVTILVTNNFLFFQLVSKLVTVLTNNFWSLNLVNNKIFSCSDMVAETFLSHLLQHLLLSSIKPLLTLASKCL